MKVKYKETGLSPLAEPSWFTIKQLKWITIPIKPQIFKLNASINPNTIHSVSQ